MDDTTTYRRLIERFMNGGMSRRSFLAALGAAGLAYGVRGGPMPFLIGEAHAAARLRYDDYGGTVGKAVSDYGLEPFEKRTGTIVERGSFGGMDELLSKLQASTPGQYNVCMLLDQFNYKRFSDLGYASELDESKIPNLANCAPITVEVFRKLSGNGKLSGVPYVYSTGVIAYNTQHIDPGYMAEAGAQALIDPKYKGKITGDQAWDHRIWYAALQSGQDPNAIADMKVLWDDVGKSKDVVVKYYSSGAEQISLFANEEAWLGDAWAGRIAVLQKQGKALKMIVAHGAYSYIGPIYVVKGSPMDAAQELLNTLLEPEVAIAVSQAMLYPTVLDPSKFKLPEEITSLAGFDPTAKFENVRFLDPNYWTARALEWQRQVQRIVSG